MDRTRRFLRIIALAFLVLALPAAGCVQRNIERIDSEEAASMPPPPPPQAPGAPTGGEEATTATRLTGTVEVADDIAASVPANATLYLIVRVAGRETGAPLAVKQLPEPSFPYRFEISEHDAMIEGTPLIGEMSITARLDQDGDAFTTTAGDLSGRFEPVVAGDSEIVVVLDEVATGDPGS